MRQLRALRAVALRGAQGRGGNSRLGTWTGIVFLVLQPIVSVIGGLFVFSNVYLIALLIFFPLSIFTAIGMGYLGGLLKERRKLYPIGDATS